MTSGSVPDKTSSDTQSMRHLPRSKTSESRGGPAAPWGPASASSANPAAGAEPQGQLSSACAYKHRVPFFCYGCPLMALTYSPPLNLLNLATIPHRFLHDFFVVTTQGGKRIGRRDAGVLGGWFFSVPIAENPGDLCGYVYAYSRFKDHIPYILVYLSVM